MHLATGVEATRVLKTLGLPEGLLPPIRKPEQAMGRVSEQASAATGLPAGLIVVTGWNDLNASVLGSGAVDNGNAFNITGSSDHAGVVTCTHHPVPELTCAPFLPGKNLLYGVTSNGGGALAWDQRSCGIEVGELIRLAEKAPAGSEYLFFLPYLDGERAPIWDPHASGAFIGIHSQHHQRHFVRAVLEGVAFALLQIFELMQQPTGGIAEPIIVSGGAARLRLWNQIKADVWGRATTVPQVVHAGVLGAAMLAAVAVGQYGSCEAAARGMVKLADRFNVAPEIHGRYRRLYAYFCELYPALRQYFARIYQDRLREKEASWPRKRQ